MKLVIERHVLAEIRDMVYATALETGVTLFGHRHEDTFFITATCGPGPNATHEYAHYSGDDNYKSSFYERLLEKHPTIKYLGEFHCHPGDMNWLSYGDLQTIREVLREYQEFLAGVMLRTHRGLVIHPVYFSSQDPQGKEMEIVYAGTAVREKPEDLRSRMRKALGHCRTWLRRQRHCRYGRPNRGRGHHTD